MIKINGIEIENERFPNGELRINEDIVLDALNEPCLDAYVEYFHRDDTSMMELFFVIKYIQDVSNIEIRVNFHYLPYSRQDRKYEDTAFTLKYLTDWINTWG